MSPQSWNVFKRTDKRKWYEYLDWNTFSLKNIMALKDEEAKKHALGYRGLSEKASENEKMS